MIWRLEKLKIVQKESEHKGEKNQKHGNGRRGRIERKMYQLCKMMIQANNK